MVEACFDVPSSLRPKIVGVFGSVLDTYEEKEGCGEESEVCTEHDPNSLVVHISGNIVLGLLWFATNHQEYCVSTHEL